MTSFQTSILTNSALATAVKARKKAAAQSSKNKCFSVEIACFEPYENYNTEIEASSAEQAAEKAQEIAWSSGCVVSHFNVYEIIS